MSVITITAENYENEVMKSDRPVLLDFWAVWCQPCMRFSPIVDEFAEENEHIKVGKINVDEQPALAEKFSIFSIPTVILIKDGKVINKSSGGRSKEQLADFVDC